MSAHRDEEFTPGTLEVVVGKARDVATRYSVLLERLAAARDGTLYLLGAVGTTATLSGLRAALNADCGAEFLVSGVRASDGERGGDVRRVGREPDFGYSCHVHHLGHGHVHALFRSRAPGFLAVVSDEAIYAELKRPRYTTPILRPWVPAIAERLRSTGRLAPLYCLRCAAALMTATSDDLDAIVSAGIRDESLPFRELAVI
jgi:hypothetical protein